jgi:hypothetical protein
MTKIYGLYYDSDTGAREDGNVMYMGSGNTEFFSTEFLRDCRADELEKIFRACHDAEDVTVPEIWTKFEFELDSVDTNTIPESLLEDLKESFYDLHEKDGEYILEDLE